MQKYLVIAVLLTCPFVTSFMPKGEEGYKLRTVVIDPGHGGHDPGCLGLKSQEKDIALALALKLGKHIEEQFSDVKVIFTRKSDQFIELHKRAAIANENHADLFICIHLNSGPKTAFGSETYVMGLHKSAANLEVAKRENASILLEDNFEELYDGYDPRSPEGHAILELFQSAHLHQSLSLATKVQESYRTTAKMKDRGVKQAGFLVLYRTTMPSVLVESGFLTNPDEEAFLMSEEGQNQVAAGLFKAFSNYKKEIEASPVGKVVVQSTDAPDSTGHEPEREKESAMAGHESRVNPKPGTEHVPEGDIPEATERGVIFKVQIVSSANRMALNDPALKEVQDVTEYNDNGIYKYVAGNARTFPEASRLQAEIRSMGFADAFIVAFRDGQKIPLREALQAAGN